MRNNWHTRVMVALSLLVLLAGRLVAQDAEEDAQSKPAAPAHAAAEQSDEQAPGLASEQQQVAERFRELQRLLLRMAELTAPTDPRRAALLRRVVAQSNERDLVHQFEQLVELLKQERLAPAVKNQTEVQQDLVKLLELLLSEDRSKHIESEKARIKEYLKRVNRIIKEQKGIQGETSREGDSRKLADRQGDLSDKTGELAGDIATSDANSPTKQAEQDKPAEDGDKKDGEKKEGEKQEGEKQDADKNSGKGDDQKGGGKPEGENKDGQKQDGEKQSSDKQKGEKKEGDKKDGEKQDSEKQDSEKQDGEGKDPKDAGDKPSEGEPGDKSDQNSEGKPQDAKPQDGKPQDGKPGQPQDPPQGQQGENSDTPPPEEPHDNPAQKRLQQAQQRMKEAQEKLEKAKRDEATEKQVEALKELEQAKADLEEILRQLREEETSRMLAMLEARFRKMLDQQIEVYEGTKRLDQVPQADRDRDDEIEAGRLKGKEMQIAVEADKALAVLHEEGSAVAFPEAVSEMREDMGQVVDRLGQAKVGEVTQGLEQDIIAALEEMIASLQKAQKDQEDKAKAGQPPADGNSEPPLVDTLSELKMIRALQMRVNQRTQRYAEMTKSEQTDEPELLEALRRLAEREQKIHQVTRDIAVGRNQ